MRECQVLLAEELGHAPCPVAEEIEPWFWRALDLRRQIVAGLYTASDLDRISWELADTCGSAVDTERVAFEERRRERAERYRAAAPGR